MQKLTLSTTLKLLWPICYLLAALIFFSVTWPAQPKLYHLLGVAITMTAFACWIIARIQLGNAFSIAPHATFIVRSGFYSRLRHPVYYFSVLAVIGLSLYIWHWLLLAVLLLFVLLQLFRIRAEEAMLAKHFGDDYLDYKQSTWF